VNNFYKIKIVILVLGIFLPNTLMAATIDINLDGFRNNRGQALIYLHNRPDSFPTKPDNAVAFKKVQIRKMTAKTKFENIEAGLYGVSVVHDENNDGTLETNFIGIPKEGRGASNNAKAKFGPPSFDDASFKLESNTQLSITIQY